MLSQYLSEKGRVRLCLQLLVVRSYSVQHVSFERKLHPPQNNVYYWNLNIMSCFRRGDVELARRIFDDMPKKNLVTWNCIISGYIQNYRLVEAQLIFENMPRRNVVSWTALLTGYARCGMLEEALELFDRMPEKNDVCWNSMITGCMENGRIVKARELFDNMPMRNFVSWMVMIRGYLQHGLVTEARELFDCAPERSLPLCNVLLSGHVELGYFEEACQIFDNMPQRDVASWTMMITFYSRVGKINSARKLFDEMPEKCIKAWTAIICGYLQAGDVGAARDLFDKMPQRDVVAWNSMISGYVQNGMLNNALKLFYVMPKQDLWSWNSILQGYVQKDDMVCALSFFEKMPSRDETSWNILISGYQNEKALSMFSRMIQEGFRPDQGTFSIVISVCANLSALGWGKMMHLWTIKFAYEHDTKVVSSLITMYSNCGLIADAGQLFERLSKRDTIAWNAMIAAQAYHGSSVDALHLFPAMIQAGFKPDHVTFLGLLSACVHGGLVEKGLHLFYSMQKDWNLVPKPEHYTCVVDLLGRSGLLGEAYNFIQRIPVDLPTNAWETLLSMCRVHGNLEIGELAAKKIFTCQPFDGGACLLLSNIYSAKEMWEDAARTRSLMKEHNKKKEPSCSWIEVNGKTNTFMYSDRSHPQIGIICKVLDNISSMMEEIGGSLDLCLS